MSQKRARATRKKGAAVESKDTRQARRLDPTRAAASRITAYLQGTLQQVLGSKEVENIVAGYLDGSDLKGDWGIQLRGQQFGEIWLIPRVKQPELPPEPPGGPSAGKAANSSPSKPQVDDAKKPKDSA